jgi:hypothetical protein
MARTTDRPRGARLPGAIATATESTRRQPRVRASAAALESAGVELAPLNAATPAAFAAASRVPNPATKSRASARSR